MKQKTINLWVVWVYWPELGYASWDSSYSSRREARHEARKCRDIYLDLDGKPYPVLITKVVVPVPTRKEGKK